MATCDKHAQAVWRTNEQAGSRIARARLRPLAPTGSGPAMSMVLRQVYRGNAWGIQSHHNPDDGGTVHETLVSTCNQLTWLCAREDFIEFSHCKSFKLFDRRLSAVNPLKIHCTRYVPIQTVFSISHTHCGMNCRLQQEA
jgi:hypothetical protein